MSKVVILSLSDSEEHILDRIKDLLAKETDIELVNPPSEKNSISFPNLELHLRKQTVKWQGQLIHLTHLEFFTLAYLAVTPAGSTRRNRSTRLYGTSSQSIAVRL